MLYKTNYVPTVNEASFQAKPIDEVEVDAIRADVLALTERTPEARALLASVLQQDPKNVKACEAMGFLEMRSGNSSSAQKWFAQAVQLNSTSYLAHYYYGVLLLRNGDVGDGAVFVSSLNQAIALNPNFAEAYDTLAMFYAARAEKLEEAYILEVRACSVDPGNLTYRMNAASILADQHKFPSALSVLNAAAKMAKSSSDKSNVQFRIKQTEDYQAKIERQQNEGATLAAQARVTPGTVSSRVSGGSVIEIHEASTTPKYPTEPPTGTKHSARGILKSVQCYFPAIMTLTVMQQGNSISLYSNNYRHIEFSAANFTPQGTMDPCTAIVGMKARVNYAEVSDKSIAGQIISVELTR